MSVLVNSVEWTLTYGLQNLDNRVMSFYRAFLLLGLMPFCAFATLSVRINGIEDDTELLPRVRLSTNGVALDMTSVRPSGDGTSSTGPARAFLPVRAGNDDTPNASLYSVNGSNNIQGVPVFQTNTYPGFVTFEKEVTITSDEPATHYLHAAVETTSGYRIASVNSAPISNGILRQVRGFTLTLQNLCDTTGIDCNTLTNPTAILEVKVYFFLNRDILPLDDPVTITDANLSHGVHYQLNFSSRNNANVTTVINDSFRGDASAVLDYTTNSTISQLNRTLVFRHAVANPTPNLPVGDYANIEVIDQQFPAQVSGVITVARLPNNTESVLSVALIDNYGYVTPLSPAVSVIPLQIEELLQEESCFFFTAGFSREHPVIFVMKEFRDQVLGSFSLGRAFVKFYYAWAPNHAQKILNSPKLQYTVQTLGTGLAWFFENLGLVLIFVFGTLSAVTMAKIKRA